MIIEKDLCFFDTPFGNKWNLLIIKSLLDGDKRYSEIKKDIKTISDRLLTEKTKELEKFGILKREILKSTIPSKVIYKLTEKGLELKDTFLEIDKWIIKYF